MIIPIVQKVVVGLLLIILVFNLTQRKHLSHGERKRYASLYAAGLLLLFWAITLALVRASLPAILLAAAAALEIVALFAFRRQILIFAFRCTSCRARLPLERILYYDSNQCPTCDPDPEAIRAARIEVETSPMYGGATVTRLRATSRVGTAEVPAALSPAGAVTAKKPAAEGPVPRSVEEIDWTSWRPKEQAVLCFVERNGQLLLIHKKRGLGAGKINAPGGRIEPGETAAQAAVRESEEEVGITPHALRQTAELSFQFTDGYSLLGYVFFADSYLGTPHATDEADPFWCSRTEIPYDRMWEDDRLWLPEVLAGKYVVGRFIFEGDSMLSRQIAAR